MKAVAAIVREPAGPFLIETVDIAPPRADEVLIRMAAVGICHSDVAFASGAMGAPLPMIFGHEGAGIIEACGSAITGFCVGDKVLATFDSCGTCRCCTRHNPAYCRDFGLLNLSGARPDGSSAVTQDGAPISAHFFSQSSFASHAIARGSHLLKLSAEADLAVLAPFGCGIQTGAGAVMRSLAAKPGMSLIIVGAGAVGLSAVMAGRIVGCAPIIVIEPSANRRAQALALGADHAFNPVGEDPVAAVKSVLPEGADMVIDTSGNGQALSRGIEMLGALGTLGMIGLPKTADATLALPIVSSMIDGLTVRGIMEGDSFPDDFLPELIAHYEAGRLPVDRIVTRYAFDRINDAIADMHAGKCVKAVLTFA